MTIELQQPPLGLTEAELADPADVIAAIGRGEFVVIVDDEDRENEGDLIIAAEFADAAAINFMITYGRGLVCLPMPAVLAHQLELPAMVDHNADHMGTAFTVSIDATPSLGVHTGISAAERARTIEIALRGEPSDLVRPGHIFPLIARDGGVLERPGHTEAGVELARLAGLAPVGVIVEIIGDDGEMLRLPDLRRFAARHGLLISSIELLRAYLREQQAAA